MSAATFAPWPFRAAPDDDVRRPAKGPSLEPESGVWLTISTAAHPSGWARRSRRDRDRRTFEAGAWIERFNDRPLAERDTILGEAYRAGAVSSAAPTGHRRGGQGRPGDEAARRAWAMPPARGKLHGIDLALLDPAHPDDRSILLEAEHPEFERAIKRNEDVEVDGETVNPRLHLALHEIVAGQLWDGEPPETWAAAQRLIGQGSDRHGALHVLMRAVSDIVFAALNEPLTDRTGDLRAALDGLGTHGPKASPRRLR